MAEGGEELGEDVGEEDCGEDVACAAVDGGERESRRLNLDDIAVFFAQCAVANEGGKT